jgi:hypothetical protein
VQYEVTVPTVADRVAQMVVKEAIEPSLESVFLADSYGYRPGKSALDAVGVTRERCWRYEWVFEFDIKGLFDNIDHELLCRLSEGMDPGFLKIMPPWVPRWVTCSLCCSPPEVVQPFPGMLGIHAWVRFSAVARVGVGCADRCGLSRCR